MANPRKKQSKKKARPKRAAERATAAGYALTPTELQLARTAARKLDQGQQPTVREERALVKLESEKEERARWKHYRSIPKKHYVEMSGRQRRVLDDQARTYGFPLLGSTIDLTRLLPAFHDFLRENAHRLARDDEEAELMAAESTPALERLREAKARIAELDYAARTGAVVERDALRTGWGVAAQILRRAGETLGKEYGAEAQVVLEEAIDDAMAAVDQQLAGGDEVDQHEEHEGTKATKAKQSGRRTKRASKKG